MPTIKGAWKAVLHIIFQDLRRFCGGYDLHPNELPPAIAHMKKTSESARSFFLKEFPEEIRNVIQRGKGTFIDDETGLCATFLFEHPPGMDKPTIHIVFPGTGAGRHIVSNITTDLCMLAGDSVPPSFIQARKIVEAVQKIAGDKADIEVKGFSLGGAIATYAGMWNEIKTINLAPLPISPAVWKSLINKKRKPSLRACERQSDQSYRRRRYGKRTAANSKNFTSTRDSSSHKNASRARNNIYHSRNKIFRKAGKTSAVSTRAMVSILLQINSGPLFIAKRREERSSM